MNAQKRLQNLINARQPDVRLLFEEYGMNEQPTPQNLARFILKHPETRPRFEAMTAVGFDASSIAIGASLDAANATMKANNKNSFSDVLSNILSFADGGLGIYAKGKAIADGGSTTQQQQPYIIQAGSSPFSGNTLLMVGGLIAVVVVAVLAIGMLKKK